MSSAILIFFTETMMSNPLKKQGAVMDLDSSVAERVLVEDRDISTAGSTDMLLVGENKQDPLNGLWLSFLL